MLGDYTFLLLIQTRLYHERRLHADRLAQLLTETPAVCVTELKILKDFKSLTSI
jgi:hypothetical protein